MLLEGRVALVTGAGRGIGREFALALAQAGASVVVNDIGVGLRGDATDEDPAAAVCKEIEAMGGHAVPAHDSVADFAAAERIVQTAVNAFGKIDILVNNAGIVRDRTLVKMTEDDFDAVIATHLKGAFNCTRHAVPLMKEAGYGRVINITSSAGLRGNFGQTNYGAAKAGLMGMTFVWALELARSGITVNALAPAGATRMTANLYSDDAPPPPTLDPALNAPIVVYLASERAAHVNGQIFGRTDWSYTLFQHPKQIAWMHREGGWDPDALADAFDTMLGQHLQTVGMVMPGGLSQDTARSSVATFNHVGHCVTDLGRSRRFYEEVFDFTFARELRVPDQPADRLLRIEAPVNITAVYLERDGLVLELMQFDRPNPPARARVMNEPGLTHLSISVDDVDTTLAKVRELGGEVLDDTNLGGWAVMIRDPDGQLIEVLPMSYRQSLPKDSAR